jgi:hypothetical protein
MKTLVAKLFVAAVILVSSPAFTLARMIPMPAAASPCGTCNNIVYGGHYTEHRVYLYRGHAHIFLSGDGASDLDLHIFDPSGEVARSVSRSDDEMVHLDVYRSGYFTIRVVNLGRASNIYRFWVE